MSDRIPVVENSILVGDCIELLKCFPDNYFSAIVTDPPFGLEFMGKDWDAPWKERWQDGSGFSKPGIGDRETPWPSFSATSRYGAANPTCAKCGGRARGAKKCSCETPEWKPIGKRRNAENEGLPGDMTENGTARHMQAFQDWCGTWAVEVFRVLKPGGHALVFGGERTYHRLACGLEDAGFEVRNTLGWVFATGFPKSQDVSKGIDKMSGRVGQDITAIKLKLAALFDSSGKSRKQIDEECGFRACNYLSYPTEGKRFDPWFYVLPSQEKWQKIKSVVGQGNPETNAKLDEWLAEAEREIVGQQTKARKTDCGIALPTTGDTEYKTWDVTVPATDLAKQWDGWGTALKPSYSPILLLRKPIMTTVAANVLKHGTGALNIGGCKVDLEDGSEPRWPANVLHDGSSEAVESLGEAARFFYCPKASKSERNAGLDDFEEVVTDVLARHRSRRMEEMKRPDGAEPAKGRNHHPCVKPLSLLKWLCRLITPPGGLILDPFFGSGSTGIAAMLEGFKFIGIERDEGYAKIARARLDHWSKK